MRLKEWILQKKGEGALVLVEQRNLAIDLRKWAFEEGIAKSLRILTLEEFLEGLILEEVASEEEGRLLFFAHGVEVLRRVLPEDVRADVKALQVEPLLEKMEQGLIARERVVHLDAVEEILRRVRESLAKEGSILRLDLVKRATENLQRADLVEKKVLAIVLPGREHIAAFFGKCEALGCDVSLYEPEADPKIDTKFYDNAHQEVLGVVEGLKSFLDQGVSPEDMRIIVRNRKDMMRIVRGIETAGILVSNVVSEPMIGFSVCSALMTRLEALRMQTPTSLLALGQLSWPREARLSYEGQEILREMEGWTFEDFLRPLEDHVLMEDEEHLLRWLRFWKKEAEDFEAAPLETFFEMVSPEALEEAFSMEEKKPLSLEERGLIHIAFSTLLDIRQLLYHHREDLSSLNAQDLLTYLRHVLEKRVGHLHQDFQGVQIMGPSESVGLSATVSFLVDYDASVLDTKTLSWLEGGGREMSNLPYEEAILHDLISESEHLFVSTIKGKAPMPLLTGQSIFVPRKEERQHLVDCRTGMSPQGLTTIGVRDFEDYAQCPFFFYAKKVLKIEPHYPEFDLKKGIIAHSVLEEWTKRGDEIDIESLVDQALSVEVMGHNEKLFLRETLIDQIQALVEEDRKRRETFKDYGPVAVEVPCHINVGGVQIRGRIDRIDEGPEGEILLDYKSSDSHLPTSNNLWNGEFYQLPIYMLSRREQGKRIVGAGYGVLSKGIFKMSLQDEVISKRYSMSAEEIDAHLDDCDTEIRRHIAKLQRGDFRPIPKKCKEEKCPYWSFCGVEWRKGEEDGL